MNTSQTPESNSTPEEEMYTNLLGITRDILVAHPAQNGKLPPEADNAFYKTGVQLVLKDQVNTGLLPAVESLAFDRAFMAQEGFTEELAVYHLATITRAAAEMAREMN